MYGWVGCNESEVGGGGRGGEGADVEREGRKERREGMRERKKNKGIESIRVCGKLRKDGR